MPYSLLAFLRLAFGTAIVFTSASSIRGEESTTDVHFVRSVLPVIKSKCLPCHGNDPADLKGGFDASSPAALLKGGESGEPALVPGKAAESPFYQAVTRTSDFVSAMPPKENDALTEEQISAIREWIDQGGNWPASETIAAIQKKYQAEWDAPSGLQVVTSGGLSPDWTNRRYAEENLWAYQPLWDDPQGWLKDSTSHPVDALINRKLQDLKLSAAPRSDRRSLIRRATYDLIGLPPSTIEIQDFINDPESDQIAFSKVVDRLLESPHYGERWGRHWLDVVRYADSSGFANDYERGNAWRYRDYVVRSFNADKPYDEFIVEQIAGDELSPQEPENLIAVGFLRMGPWELTGMEVAKVARQRFLDDVTDIVGQTFLAHMLQCARCHDHKFDPVPTRDYYSIQATFATTQLAERRVEFLDTENLDNFEEQHVLLKRKDHYNQVLQQLKEKQTVAAAYEWYRQSQKDPAQFEQTLKQLSSNSSGRDVSVSEIRTAMQKAKIDPELIPPRHVGFDPVDFGLERVARKGLERLKWRLERYEPFALSVYNGKTIKRRSVNAPLRIPENPTETGELEETCILTGGDPFSAADAVSPGVLSAVSFSSALPVSEQPQEADAPVYNRRLALARWIADKKNPLTARVMVNRIWQWHFHQAIAGNPNNFGTTGKKPTHPELLDYLAGRFLESGWSVKAMHRLIMNSEAYCRSTEHPDSDQIAKLDPTGESYAVFEPRRLSAEELRDSILAVSGELNRQLGGIPIRPEMNLDAALQPRQVMGTFAEAWQPSRSPEQRHRRSLYVLQIRGQRDPFMEVFDAPGGDLSCERRDESTITPQVFALFNNHQTYLRGLALANRLINTYPSNNDSEIINHLFTTVLGREPTANETTICLNHWEAMTQRHQALVIPSTTYPLEVTREAVEENTGEKFVFVEPLEFYQDFVPDLQPSDVTARVRGLAEVGLVLLNSNEFAYVY